MLQESHYFNAFMFISVQCSYLILVYVRFVDAIMTIPKGTLFPMCGMNLGFNRELIGPAMYFGLMGDGQPIGRYDDMWAGWCSKVSPALFIAIFCDLKYIIPPKPVVAVDI